MKNTFKILAAGLSLIVMAMPAHADLKAGLDALDAKKYDESAKLLAEAFDAGEPDAAFYMGRILELGLVGPADITGAIALFAAGSAKGSSLAKNRLGILHMEGTGVLQDFEQGAKLICEAADAGDDNAQFNCGTLYVDGKGVKADTDKAIAYFSKASELGNIGAMNTLADEYVSGTKIAIDNKKAFALFQKTASVGNPYGLFSLGKAYADGIGTEQDLVKAHAYLNLSAARGFPDATPLRSVTEAKLTPEQITEAQQFARAWRPDEQEQNALAVPAPVKKTKNK